VSIFHQAIALLVVFIWGTNFVFIRIGLDELAPFTFATLRFVLVVIPLAFIFSKPKASWRSLIGYGLFIGFGQFGLLFWAMQSNITPGLASLIIQMQVFFTILLAVFLANETINRKQIIALCLCALGLAIIIAYTDGQTTLIGIVVVLLAAFSWSCGNLVVKTIGDVDVLAFIVWSSIFAIPPLALMAYFTEGMDVITQSVMQASCKVWLVILWQSIGNTLVGYGLWNLLLNKYSAATVVPWALLVPVFGMAASAIVLSEPLPWWKLVAMVLIITGLAFNMLNTRGQAS